MPDGGGVINVTGNVGSVTISCNLGSLVDNRSMLLLFCVPTWLLL